MRLDKILFLLRQILFIVFSLLTTACVGNEVNSRQYQPNNGLNLVTIGDISTIPTLNKVSNKYDYISLPVYNNSDQDIKLRDITIYLNGTQITGNTTDQFLDASDCLKINLHSNCKLKLFAKHQINGYMLQLNFANGSQARQLISLNPYLPNQNGFIYSQNNLALNPHNNRSLNIPFRLAVDYTEVKVFANNHTTSLSCTNGYRKDSLCTAHISNKPRFPNKSTSERFSILGYYGADKYNLTTATVDITNNLSAHLITSASNLVVNPDDGSSPQQVFLYNNGTNTASSISIRPVNPLIISANTCGTTLSAGSSCSFFLNVTGSITSGQTDAAVTYTDSQNTQALNFNVNYISPVPAAALTLTPSGNFTNVVINSFPVFYTINITNTGNIAFSGLKFNNVGTQVATMSAAASGTTCVNNQSLAVGSSCIMVLSYDPTAVASGTVNFISSAAYLNQGGQIQSYAVNLPISYSAVAGATFQAVGDFGMVITSPAGAAGTWTAAIDSPFAAATQSLTGMTKMNSIYAVSRNDGAVKYSALNGIFWQNAAATNMDNNNTCGITNDGAFYYTCGRINSPYLSTCTLNNRYCIIKSNNLTAAWSPLFQAANTNAMNGIFYYTNGAQKAYVVTNANTVANSGLITSTNGTTFAATSSGQATAGNNNFTPVAYNNLTDTLFAWVSTGFSSSRALTSVGSAWTSSTARPANTVVTGAVYANNTYLVTTSTGAANGLIYSTTNPLTGGTYTNVLPNVAQALNEIVFNSSGPNFYLAVGNAGKTAYSNSTTGAAGSWTQGTVVVGQASTPNLSSAYVENSTAIWAMGVNALVKSRDSAVTWFTPGLVSITKNGSSYLAIDNQGNIYSSSNLNAWSQQTNPSGNVLNEIYCPAANLCFAVGNSGTILKSTNGATWSAVSSGTTNSLQSITCNVGLSQCVIVGGAGTANSGTILFSNNYTAWTAAAINLATTSLNSISFLDGQYIAVGNNGVIYTSTNAVNWRTRTSPTANNLNSIVCSPIGCSAGGANGAIIFSASGTSWAAAASGTINDINSLAFDSIFVAVGNGGYISFSSTGSGTWTAAAFPTTSSATNNLNFVIND